MGGLPLVLDEVMVRSLVSRSDALEAARQAQLALAAGGVVTPEHIGLRLQDGEIHVKSAYLLGSPYVAFKVATGFPANVRSDRPVNDGFTMVLDAQCGALLAELHDHGWLTELRTGAAGALATNLLARADATTVAVLGAGTQAEHQLAALLGVRSVSTVWLYNRTRSRAEMLAARLRETYGLVVQVADSVAAAVVHADIVITTTASRAPLLHRDLLRPGMHITAMGSDFADKQELHVDVLAAADLVVADGVLTCARYGEVAHAVQTGTLALSDVVELSDVVGARHPGRTRADQITVVDQCGLGIYDAIMAELVMVRHNELCA